MPLLHSWIASANHGDSPFPLNNLPYGVFSTAHSDPRCGVAIGQMILDLQACEEAGLIDLGAGPVFDVPFWNELMEQGPEAWGDLRNRLLELLGQGSTDQSRLEGFMVAQSDACMHPVSGVGIHRFLCRTAPCHQCRHHVSRRRECLATQLASFANRL